VLEGRRAVALEIQSLVAPNDGPHPRRVAHGLERERLEVLAAVLRQRAGIDLSKSDVFVRVAGGFRADEPAVDLALALALASSVTGAPVPPDLVAIGEVGLAGDVRAVPGIGTRLGECARLGFGQAVVGRSVSVPDGLKVHAVAQLRDALALLGPA
jgi:DNA repair protein RadA/Sms